MASIADRRLSIIGAAVLASLDGAASNIVLVGAPLNELVSLLGSIARMLPSPIADQIRFIGTTGDLDNIDDSETRIVCAETYNRSKRRRSTIVDISVDEVSHIREVQSYFPVIDRLVSWVRDGGLVAGHLATVDELIRWINARELMLRSATELSSAELSAVLSMGDDSVSWLDRPGVLAQVCERAVVDEDVLQALVRLGSSRLRTLTPEICRALYLFDISAGEQRRVLRALAIDGDTYLEHALGAFWAEWRPGILMSEGQRETIFPVIAADAGLAQQENLPVLDELLRSQSFRGYAASGAAPIVSRMLTREFGKSPDARDYFALGAAARRRPGAVVSFMTDGARSRDGRAIAWAIDELDLDNALAVLTETAAAQASSPSVVFDLLAHSSRTEAERRRLLRGVWPLLQQLVGVPPQMRDWLIVAEPSSRSATLQPDDSPLWGKISPQPADHLIPDPVLSTPPNDARPGVMQRIRKIFGITE